MRRASPARLERLFALIVTVGIPAVGVGAMVACGGSTQNGPAGGEDGGGGSSSGGGSSGSSSGTASSGSSSGFGGSSSGSSSSGSSSGVVCGGCNCGGPNAVTLDGGLPDGSPMDGGFLPYTTCETICAGGAECYVANPGPPIVVDCQVLCLGRRPAGLEVGEACARTSLGAYFARAAQLEAASVPALRRMARELARFGAPRRLVKAAERAARDEIRHARGATSFAKRYGAKRASFTADAQGERSLEAFATENAIEGCVRETYGALVATWQAREAGDPLVRAHMARIAKEETTHAALAWRADAWARGKLAKDARARVDTARAKAARELIEEAAGESPAEVAAVAGLPDAATARRLAATLAASLV